MKKLWNVLTLVVMTVMMPLAAHALAGPVDPPPVPAMSGDNLEPPAQAALTAANARASPEDEYCVASPGGDKMQCLELGEHGKRYPKTKWCNLCHEKNWTPKKIKDDPHIPV